MMTTTMMIRRFLQLLLVVLMTYHCQARSLPGNENGQGVWQPPNRTMAEWLNCRGMPEEVCERTNSKYRQLIDLIAQEKGIEKIPPPTGTGLVPDSPPTLLADQDQGGCMWLTEEQLDVMYEEAQHRNDLANKRKKRTLSDFKKYPNIKWSLPIHYKFDGTQSDSQKKTIRDAFQHWMDNTCIRFTELPTNTPYTGNHIILTSQAAGCYSYVGKTNYIPQPINLYASCLFRFGTPVHEIGHTLGLYHEQMRRDRDSSISIDWPNVVESYASQFNLVEGTDGLGQPYNYGSVMHYSSKESVSKNGGDTMIAKQPLYQMNMGQRTGLSFHDAKLMNLAYCPSVCQKRLSQSCQRGGYQNPNDCSRCTCPDGFSGTYCENIAPSKNGNCGGVLNIGPNSQQVITSPGYSDRRYYLSKQECTWWIKAPQNYKLQLTFTGDFGVYCEFGACYHWVEVKYKQDLGQEGGRFCCYDRPKTAVNSESNEMMVVFKSNYSVDYFPTQRGFQAVVKTIPRTAGDNDVDLDETISSPTTESTTTATTTTTPTTTTTTTQPSTTPTTTTTTTTTTPSTTTTAATTTTTTTTIGLPSTNTSFTSTCGRQDVVFLLDSSEAVGSENWPKILNFVGSVASNILVQQSRISVITFGSSASTVIRLDDNDVTTSVLLNAVASIPYKASTGRNIAAALEAMRAQVASSDRRQTGGVAVNCVLVTAGPSIAGDNSSRDRLVDEARLAKSSGIGLIVVAVGSLVSGSEAATIAGRGDSGVVYAEGFDRLTLSTDDTTKKLCRPPQSAMSVSGDALWQCSFDSPSSADSDRLCGMTQDTSDDFDWTVYHDPTPSDPTGPDFPYDGYNFLFIEASDPRQPNDEARLFFPKFNSAGEVCVDFYYHMYGFHINALKLVRITENQSTVVWMRTKQIGNVWMHASVGVELSRNSQLQFIGIRGEEFSGDIGLDKILVKSGACAV